MKYGYHAQLVVRTGDIEYRITGGNGRVVATCYSKYMASKIVKALNNDTD